MREMARAMRRLPAAVALRRNRGDAFLPLARARSRSHEGYAALADDAINPALTAGLGGALDGTPKVKAYLAAHARECDARKLTGARGVYQVIAGNGGSALEAGWAASPPYYGFSEARVYTTGRVGIVSHQRPVPTPYDSPTVVAANPAPELTIVP
jgi:hypothetical protein